MLTKKQIEMRRTGIGASEIAALAGLSRWATPVDIYAAKVLPTKDDPTLVMELGNLLEEPISRVYAKRTGAFLHRCTTLRHPKHSVALATPDRLVFRQRVLKAQALPQAAERLLQVKTAGWRSRPDWGPEGTDQVPEDYLAQVQWEMGVTGQRVCDVALLIERDDFRIYTVPFNERLFGGLLEIAERFWVDHVQARKPPPPDASEAYAEFLKRAHPREAEAAKMILEPPPEIIDAAERLRVAEADEAAAKERADLAKNEIRSFIGDNLGVVGPFGTITWKANKDSTPTDWKGVAEDAMRIAWDLLGSHPEAGTEKMNERGTGQELKGLVDRHTKRTPGARVLRKKWIEKPQEPGATSASAASEAA